MGCRQSLYSIECFHISQHPCRQPNADHLPTALIVYPLGDLSALRIHASLKISKLLALPWTRSTEFSSHPWKETSDTAFTSLLFQKLREFCDLKSANTSCPLVLLALCLLSSSRQRTTASDAADSWTKRCCTDISAFKSISFYV